MLHIITIPPVGHILIPIALSINPEQLACDEVRVGQRVVLRILRLDLDLVESFQDIARDEINEDEIDRSVIRDIRRVRLDVIGRIKEWLRQDDQDKEHRSLCARRYAPSLHA